MYIQKGVRQRLTTTALNLGVVSWFKPNWKTNQFKHTMILKIQIDLQLDNNQRNRTAPRDIDRISLLNNEDSLQLFADVQKKNPYYCSLNLKDFILKGLPLCSISLCLI